MASPIVVLRERLADRYRVDREIGAGGMATVYLAHDLRHDRPVALKVLNPELAAVIGTERFLAEIRVTANLQHPHILPLFDSGEVQDPDSPGGRLLFYVMPYVQGETLRAKLDREKQLPVDEAVRIGIAVASALDHAHASGVIHRDLKPENVLLQAGHAVVADFGIALAVSNAGGTRLTQTGISLGTPQYMSPEQAAGDRVSDARSDIYSLGVLLYEMLTGEPPHTGPSGQAILARILTDAPRGVRTARPSVPRHIERVVERCLEKVPGDRFAAAREVVAALQEPSGDAQSSEDPRSSRLGIRRATAVVAIVATFAAGGLVTWALRPTPHEIDRFEVFLPPGQRLTNLTGAYPAPYGFADGSGFVYSGVDGQGINRVYRRTFGRATADLVPGISGEVARGWVIPSPDGKQLAFLTVPGLRTFIAAASGGEPRLLTDSLFGVTAWGRDGNTIYGVHVATGVVARIPVSGGRIEPLAKTDTTRRSGHWMPDPLPRDRGVLITIRSGDPDRMANAQVAVVDPAGTVRLLTEGFAARYAEPGYVMFARADGVLYAATFDLDRLQLGTPVPVIQDVAISAGSFAYYSLTPDGTLLYEPASQTNQRNRLTWVDRSGREIGPRIDVEDAYVGHPRLSPDGTEIAYELRWDVFAHSLRSGTTTQVSRDADSDVGTTGFFANPQWKGDDLLTMGGMPFGGRWHLYTFARTAPGPARAVLASQPGITESVWRPSGGLVFVVESRERGTIRYTVADSASVSTAFGDAATDEHAIALSPNGHWLAYVSDRDVWVSRFPDGGARVRVSRDGGTEPRWSHSGNALYYRTHDSLVIADLGFAPTLEVHDRTPLFSTRGYAGDSRMANYDVSADEKRFLFVKIVGDEDRPKYIVVERHWANRLRQLVPR